MILMNTRQSRGNKNWAKFKWSQNKTTLQELSCKENVLGSLFAERETKHMINCENRELKHRDGNTMKNVTQRNDFLGF